MYACLLSTRAARSTLNKLRVCLWRHSSKIMTSEPTKKGDRFLINGHFRHKGRVIARAAAANRNQKIILPQKSQPTSPTNLFNRRFAACGSQREWDFLPAPTKLAKRTAHASGCTLCLALTKNRRRSV